MSQEPSIDYEVGLAENHFPRAAEIYDQAFGEKFKAAVRSQRDRLALLRGSFRGSFAITASTGGELVGLAGFHTPEGSLTGGLGARQLLSRLGLLRGARALAVFSLYERTPEPGELVMDGIAVDRRHRGLGIGTRLLDGIVEHARTGGFRTVRLDVIDTNPGARRLYERRGFLPVRSEKFPYLRGLLGFGGSTTMVLRLADSEQQGAEAIRRGELRSRPSRARRRRDGSAPADSRPSAPGARGEVLDGCGRRVIDGVTVRRPGRSS